MKQVGTRQYHVFSIYTTPHLRQQDAQQSLEQDHIQLLQQQQQRQLVLRLSTDNLADANMWLDMLQRACNPTIVDVHDLFPPVPIIQEPNILKSSRISSSILGDDSYDAPPLSPEAAAIHDFSNNEPSISTLDNAANTAAKNNEDDISPSLLHRVQSSTLILQQSRTRHGPNSPMRRQDHTSPTSPKAKPSTPSLGFPGSKNVHTRVRSSPLALSSEATGRVGNNINLKGFLNLFGLILFVTHFRLVYDTLLEFWNQWIVSSAAAGSNVISWSDLQHMLLTTTAAISSHLLSLFLSYSVEKAAIFGYISDSVALACGFVLGNNYLPLFYVSKHYNFICPRQVSLI